MSLETLEGVDCTLLGVLVWMDDAIRLSAAMLSSMSDPSCSEAISEREDFASDVSTRAAGPEP